MKDKRKIEIIKLVLDWLEKNPEKFRCSLYYTDGADGICGIVEDHVNLTSFEEQRDFNKYVMAATKRRDKDCRAYIFKPGNIKPRVNYLNRLLKKLET